jgi:hypothetical protein
MTRAGGRTNPRSGSGNAPALALIPGATVASARIQALAVQEQAGRLDAAAASRHRREVRRGLETELMRYVVRVGEMAAREHPELAGRFKMPEHNANNAMFLARAWDLLTLAKANQELLASHGLTGAQLDNLGSAVTRFEGSTEKANAGRRDHVGARADLNSVTTDLLDLVGLLEVLNHARFHDDAELRASWESARNVATPSRVKPAPPTDGNLGKAA